MNRFVFLLLLPCLAFSHPQTESAPALELSLRRDWGYGGLQGQIQGHFTLRAQAPEDVQRVVFYLDEDVLGEVNAPPFELRFVTDAYPLGMHTFWAEGYTADGRLLRSNRLRREFVAPSQGWEFAGRIVLPVLGVTFLALLLSALATLRGGKQAVAGNYGIAGGAVCPKCGRPFGRHWWAPNLVTGKLERCPHCGRWSIVRAASPEALCAAEQAAERPAASPAAIFDATEQLKKDLDESRYLDE